MAGPERLERRIRARLAGLRDDGLWRQPRPPRGIDLSSNDYLNLARHPLVVQRFTEAAAREGCGSTGSRLLAGDREAFAAVEGRFAQFKGTARALLFSSGYLANLAVLTTLVEAGDVVYSDDRNHASLIDAIRLSRATRVVFPHADVGRLAALMRGAAGPGERFVVTESLFSMDGDMAPLSGYAALCRSLGAALIVDEAHAVGIYGSRGSGLIEMEGVADDVCVSINPAGKALGAAGAFVAGAEWAIDYLVQRARPFIFSTAPPPALAGALEASLDLVAAEPDRRARLLGHARHLRERLSEAGVAVGGTTSPTGAAGGGTNPAASAPPSPIIPVIIGGNERALEVARSLQRAGYDVRAIRPPSVTPGTARLRLSLNADLSPATLDSFAQLLASTLTEIGPCSAVCS